MAVWRDDDPEVFKATVAAAAEQLGVQPIAVEKDYWVCEVLRAIVGAHGDEVIFKGGTSLEKLRIIQRFSEDLDLLVVGNYGSKSAARSAMKAMLSAAASTIGAKCTDEESGGNLGTLHRKAYLELPLERGEQSVGLADPTAVLIELGQSGGPNPSLDGTVESLLARALKGAVKGDWDDLRPFAVTVLHPGRTLLEKLLRATTSLSIRPEEILPTGYLASDDSSMTFGHCFMSRPSPNSSPIRRRSARSSRAFSKCRNSSHLTTLCPAEDSLHRARSRRTVSLPQNYAGNTISRCAISTTVPIRRRSTTSSNGCTPAPDCLTHNAHLAAPSYAFRPQASSRRPCMSRHVPEDRCPSARNRDRHHLFRICRGVFRRRDGRSPSPQRCPPSDNCDGNMRLSPKERLSLRITN